MLKFSNQNQMQISSDYYDIKGSRKNKFAISGVEAPGWEDVKKLEYQAYSEFSQRSQAECIDV